MPIGIPIYVPIGIPLLWTRSGRGHGSYRGGKLRETVRGSFVVNNIVAHAPSVTKSSPPPISACLTRPQTEVREPLYLTYRPWPLGPRPRVLTLHYNSIAEATRLTLGTLCTPDAVAMEDPMISSVTRQVHKSLCLAKINVIN